MVLDANVVNEFISHSRHEIKNKGTLNLTYSAIYLHYFSHECHSGVLFYPKMMFIFSKSNENKTNFMRGKSFWVGAIIVSIYVYITVGVLLNFLYKVKIW